MTEPERPPHHAFPWLRVGAVMLVAAVVFSGMWIVIRQFDDTDVTDDPSPSVEASPEASPADGATTATPPGSATPDAAEEPTWPVGSLPHMLGLAPDRLADDSLPLNDIARYADIAGWMAASGIPAPQSIADPAVSGWEAQLDNLAIPATLRERGLDPVWRQTYGFDLTQIEQVLIVGQAPDYVTILRGRFDAEELQTAWVTSGYQAVEVEGQTIWSLSPGDAIDLSARASRPAMGTLNNVVLLEDGTLIAAARISRLGSVLEVVNGNAPSLAEHDDIAALLIPGSGVDRLASAVVSKGSLLQGTASTQPTALSTPLAPPPEVEALATPEDESGMPEVNIVLFGVPVDNAANRATPIAQPGISPAMTIMLVFDDLDDAARAGQEIALRLEAATSPVTRQPYSDRLADSARSLEDREDRAVVIVDGELVRGLGDWLAMLSDRDLGFAFWMPEE